MGLSKLNPLSAPRRVIVIAGPSAVGKSTLIARLQRGQCPALAASLGLDQPDAWMYRNARGARIGGASAADSGLVLHYDLNRPVMESQFDAFASDPGLAVFLTADDSRVCTLLGDADLLRERATLKAAARLRLDLAALCSPTHWIMRRRMRKVLGWYRNATFIAGRYAAWFAFVDTLHHLRRHVVIDAAQSVPTPLPYQPGDARARALGPGCPAAS